LSPKLGVLLLACLSACEAAPATNVPVRPAPASRHQALVDALRDDARAFAFKDGNWSEDLGDAPYYGLAWLSRRAAAGEIDRDELERRDAALGRAKTLLSGSLTAGGVQAPVMAVLGVMEHIAASQDRSLVPAVDDFVDRLDALARSRGDYVEADESTSSALRTYGPTAVTALIALVEAQYALLVGGVRAQQRIDRAIALDAKIHELAFGDLVDGDTGQPARGYAFAPGNPTLFDAPNVAMLLLKGRLFRLTKREDVRLEARAVYAALQPLKLSDAPARYASPYAQAELNVSNIDTRDLSTLSGQNYLTLGLLVLFEITGDQRFIDEADRLLDGIAALRGPWCTSQVHDPAGCVPACETKQACVSAACTPERCTTGLLHHTVNGRLALPTDGALFCAGCNFQTLYVVGYRRALANEHY
jgi:hypothetical protein